MPIAFEEACKINAHEDITRMLSGTRPGMDNQFIDKLCILKKLAKQFTSLIFLIFSLKNIMLSIQTLLNFKIVILFS